jgi:hypothetical protein
MAERARPGSHPLTLALRHQDAPTPMKAPELPQADRIWRATTGKYGRQLASTKHAESALEAIMGLEPRPVRSVMGKLRTL